MGVLLVSEAKLKAFTAINKNVDMDLLKSEIQIAQDISLQTILGTKFLNHLTDQITAGGNTLSPDEKAFVDEYVSPYLIQQSYYTAIPYLNYKTLNRAIMSGEAESATAVDAGTMKYLRNIQKNRAEFYAQRMRDYLNCGEGEGKFPQYETWTSKDGMKPNKSSKYFCGIALKK